MRETLGSGVCKGTCITRNVFVRLQGEAGSVALAVRLHAGTPSLLPRLPAAHRVLPCAGDSGGTFPGGGPPLPAQTGPCTAH